MYSVTEQRLIAAKERARLEDRWAVLRELLTPSAILFVWFMLGDKMWAEASPESVETLKGVDHA